MPTAAVDAWSSTGGLSSAVPFLPFARRLGHAELRGNPDGVAASPSRLVAARPVPIGRLLLAEQLDTAHAVDGLDADDLPGAGRAAVFVDFPDRILGQARRRRLDEAAGF